MDSLRALMQGGTNGSPITRWQSDRQPADRKAARHRRRQTDAGRQTAVADGDDRQDRKWIAAGAKFDGTDPGMALARLVAVTRAKAASHEQLSRDRDGLTEKNWHLVLPDAQPNHTETEHFLVYGNVGKEDLADVGQQAEAQVPKLEKMLKVPSRRAVDQGPA